MKPLESLDWLDYVPIGRFSQSGRVRVGLPCVSGQRAGFEVDQYADSTVDEERPGSGEPIECVPFDVVAPSETVAVRLVRRAIDVTVAGTLLILTLPLILLLGVIIRWDSPGPALFWQARMTRDRRGLYQRDSSPAASNSRAGRHSFDRRRTQMAGEPFQFVKFRTMWVDARTRFPELYQYSYTDEEILRMKFKLDDDPRRTRVGRWLRTTSLDELPNLWNVLTGHMTLVGPRPEIPEMSRFYSQVQLAKFTVKPGVTGLAQVNGRGQLTFQDTLRLDLDYVTSRSLRLDLWVMWRTLLSVTKQTGAF